MVIFPSGKTWRQPKAPQAEQLRMQFIHVHLGGAKNDANFRPPAPDAQTSWRRRVPAVVVPYAIQQRHGAITNHFVNRKANIFSTQMVHHWSKKPCDIYFAQTKMFWTNFGLSSWECYLPHNVTPKNGWFTRKSFTIAVGQWAIQLGFDGFMAVNGWKRYK